MKVPKFMRLAVGIIFLICCHLASAQEECDSLVGFASDRDSIAMPQEKAMDEFKLHNAMVSYGATVPFHRSMLWQTTLAFEVRIMKNIYVGVTLECKMHRTWDFKEYRDTLYGSSIELTVKAFSNPIFQKKKFAAGFWGDFGIGKYDGYYWHTSKVGNDALNDETGCIRYYLKIIGGVYFKYRRIYATVGYHVNNLELKPFGHTTHGGIFRKPSLNGLSLMVRFGL